MASFIRAKVSLRAFVDKVLNSNLRFIIDRTDKGLVQAAEFLTEEGKKRSPIDTGNLESKIRFRKIGRNRFEIVADAVSDEGFPYAAYLHENHDWNLGPLSRAKQAGQPERIGSKYLTRAFEENRTETLEQFRENIRFTVGGG